MRTRWLPALLAGAVVLAALGLPAGAALVSAPPLAPAPGVRAAEALYAALLPLTADAPSTAFDRLARLAGVPPGGAPPQASLPTWLGDAPAGLAPVLAELWAGLDGAEAHLHAALASLAPEERVWLLGSTAGALRAAESAALGGASADERALLQAYGTMAARVDLPRLAAAEHGMLVAVESVRPRLAGLGLDGRTLEAPRCAQGDVVFEVTSDADGARACLVVVGGPGPTTYVEAARLAVDLGGDDLYLNNAGGASLDDGRGVSLALDAGEGADVYDAREAALHAVQGAGCAGVGLLVDLGGEDAYLGPERADCFQPLGLKLPEMAWNAAQGAAVLGAGALLDLCAPAATACRDTYRSARVAQGVGVVGLGLLLDEGGADHYLVPHTFDSEGMQGVGCFGGFGALVDLARGGGGSEDDVYDASVADGQGMGCAGSLGLLFDAAGDDRYVLRSGEGMVLGAPTAQSGFGQGYGEIGGLGVLLDLGGDDAYTLQEQQGQPYEGAVGQGASALGVGGFLLDLGGADGYDAQRKVQGWSGGATPVNLPGPEAPCPALPGLDAWCASASGSPLGGLAVLLDRGDGESNDAYRAVSECQGTSANVGAGLLVDVGGGRDSYACSEPAHGCLDLGTPLERGNGRVWCSGIGGLGQDNA